MLWCSFHHLSCVWGSLSFLDLWVYGFNQIWKISGRYFFKIFSVLPSLQGSSSDTSIRLLDVPLRTNALFIFPPVILLSVFYFR